MSFYVVVPARYASTRLPGKPLADIAGKPMVVRVAERCQQSEAGQVYVATDDSRIAEALEGQVPVVMTREDHPSGTDRLQEVAAKLELADDDIIVNVQGDEPLIPPRIINQVAHNLAAEQEASIATLCEDIHDIESVVNPNVVKVVFDERGLACYFSRAPIPWTRDHFGDLTDIRDRGMPEGVNYYRHIGIYAYRVKFLKAYVKWDPCPLEMAECLEQLRALWNGENIHVSIADELLPGGVDTQDDLDRVRDIIRQREQKG